MGLEIMAIAQIAGLVIGAGGAAMSYSAQREQSAATKEAEQLRKAQMELEGQRKRREILRKVQMAQATGLTRTTGQTGSAATGSSALAGTYAQEQSFGQRELGQLGASLDIGRSIFDANARASDAATGQALGRGMQTIGGALIDRSKDLGQLGGTLFGTYDPWNTSVRSA